MKTNVSMSWIIGLAVIIIAFVVLLLFLVVMPKFKVLQNLVDKLNLVTREILTGLPVIRAFSTEKHEEERFDDANRTLTKTNLFRQPCNDFYDAGDDVSHERCICSDRMDRSTWNQ